jgi:sRNA-binding regulator protein Hfq
MGRDLYCGEGKARAMTTSKDTLERQTLQAGQSYEFVFLDGKMISGKLVNYDSSNVLIEGAGDDRKLLIYKQALCYVVAAKELPLVERKEPLLGTRRRGRR